MNPQLQKLNKKRKAQATAGLEIGSMQQLPSSRKKVCVSTPMDEEINVGAVLRTPRHPELHCFCTL